VVDQAKELFWERGFEATGVADLEQVTGLNRSSLYGCFGSKKVLFDLALSAYIESFIEPLLAPMEGPKSDVRNVEGFFSRLGAMFQDDTRAARRGCLWVNSITEFSGRPGLADARAAEYRERLRHAFANALARGTWGDVIDLRSVERRARLLVGTTFGIWALVRIDPPEAVRLCAAARSEVREWSRGH
jgi:AcrR family transcriptional regulator